MAKTLPRSTPFDLWTLHSLLLRWAHMRYRYRVDLALLCKSFVIHFGVYATLFTSLSRLRSFCKISINRSCREADGNGSTVSLAAGRSHCKHEISDIAVLYSFDAIPSNLAIVQQRFRSSACKLRYKDTDDIIGKRPAIERRRRACCV